VNITINDRPVPCEPGDTVLTAARRAGIHIPSLCALDCSPIPHASCRVCVVEVEGENRLQTSCTLAVRDNLAIRTHTPRVQRLRRIIVELLLASHPDDCLYCERAGDCELARLAASVNVRGRRFGTGAKGHAVDVSSPAICRDPNKCVQCGRCVTVCHREQGVGAIDFAGRGFGTRVATGPDAGLNVSDCVFCGQCVRVCPTGALQEKSAVAQVAAALGDPDVTVVAQIAPAVTATVATEFGLRNVEDALKLVAGTLRRIGVDAVFDTSFTADLTVVEEANELVKRIVDGGPLPLFTSCSPAWVRFVELHRPELIPNLSTCKSPQQMAAALIRHHAEKIGNGRRIYSVSIMPCTAKKYEAVDVGDLDAVLTTRELYRLFDEFGVSLDGPGCDLAELDQPFGMASSSGRMFGGSGGVAEAALRTAAHLLGESPQLGTAVISPLRSSDQVRMFQVTLGSHNLSCAVVSGLGAARTLLDQLQRGDIKLDFVEVMSCAAGCVGGGGQPRCEPVEVESRRTKLQEIDRHSRLRLAHENPAVSALYAELLGEPGSEICHQLLHRSYDVDSTEVTNQG